MIQQYVIKFVSDLQSINRYHLSVCFRSSLLRDLDEEDKHRTWYFEQLENIRRKVDVLPADVVIFIEIFLLNFNDDIIIQIF